MATQERKFQFPGRLSFLLLALLSLFGGTPAWAGEYGLRGIPESGYEPAPGGSFFLLADSGFGSGEKAVIRLEGPEEALERYTGVDIVLYRIPDPLEFLREQRNLHRVRFPGRHEGEGLANALNYVWDVWYKKSRLGWQRIFAAGARAQAVAQEPLLKQAPAHTYRTRFEDNPQYAPLADFPVVGRFRYPLWEARPVQPPREAMVKGSSHEFVRVRRGNVPLPLGELSPGLYLVEGLLGRYRAATLLFVSDTAAITKSSGDQFFAWTADKQSGAAVEGSRLLLTDGTGTLREGVTGADGAAVFELPVLERSYLIALDRAGGVFVSENFYYDSELHDAKLFAFTDRPLYRPGDTVRFKLVGRHFLDARRSQPLAAGPVRLTALDPSGAPVATTTFSLDSEVGGDGAFQLPDQAPPGGYTMRLTYRGEPYAASFRVARYAKPHYDIDVSFARKSFKTGERISGVIRARYPGGQPVSGLKLELDLRSQTLAMSDYEHRQRGRFPVKLKKSALTADERGEAGFSLPAVSQASRLTLRVVGSDGSSYRVSAIRDLLVEARAPDYRIESESRVTQPGESVTFTLHRSGGAGGRVASWSMVRLEGGVEEGGYLEPGEELFEVAFPKPGSYQLEVRDEESRPVGTLSHWVAGEGMRPPVDGFSLVLDRERYRPKDTVRALVTFAGPVQEALFTLERDRVHHHGLLSRGADWFRLQQRGPSQWEVEIPVTELFQPNLTFSVAIFQDGKYSFRNKGIRVENDPIAIALTPDKPRYRPGERVTVAMTTTVAGEPVAANLAVGVVDEMVYVLQPELAPDIRDFFGHWRRNQVRTLSSLDFFTYDQAIPAVDGETPSRFDRPVKLLERPRRENVDTAAWFPRLKTDAEGRGSFSFVMPDSLTRWRITARATTPAGDLGQESAALVSEKAAYLKWSGPTRLRLGDAIQAVLLAFNTATEPQEALLEFAGDPPRQLTLKPGINHLSLPVEAEADRVVESRLVIGGEEVDRLQTPLTVDPVEWRERTTRRVELTGRTTAVVLPPGAREARVILARGVDSQFRRVASGLVDYPYGGVEQTASRLIPLALAYGSLRHRSLDPAFLTRLRDRLGNQRFRLAQMAGPDAGFTWWGDQTRGDPFFTAYAYFADHLALSALGLTAPEEHWMGVMKVYHEGFAEGRPLLNALSLWLAGELRLPVRNQALAVAKALLEESPPRVFPVSPVLPVQPASPAPPTPGGARSEVCRILSVEETPAGRELALVVLALLLGEDGGRVPGFVEAAREAGAWLGGRSESLPRALNLLHRVRVGGERVEAGEAAAILASVSDQAPTLDRALALIFIHRALGGGGAEPEGELPALEAPWIRWPTEVGGVEWRLPGLPGGGLELTLAADPPPGLTAEVTYEEAHPREGGEGVDLGLERRIYLLTPVADRPDPDYMGDEHPIETLFAARQVAPGEPLEATALYLDEVTLDPRGVNRRFGLLEVPLPPGAELDPFTWGMGVRGMEGEEEPVPLLETRAEMGEGSYVVPVPALVGDGEQGETVFRHLVRFPVRGSVNLPPVRYASTVDPEARAWGETPPTLVIR
ncbi:MAG: alpha-2-macroglobulin family protein [Magnetococcales bacterium]|nr:alpha-2-macroglobulin family protein [Magnetococcales bacterium]